MIDALKTLINKTNDLETKINNISDSKNINNITNNFICFSKGLINLSFLNSNKLLIAKFETIKGNHLYLQNQIELNIPVSQNIKISLLVNDIAIYRSTRKLQTGYNQLTIMKNYLPLTSEPVSVYLEVLAEDNSLITIISDTLFVWGLSNISKKTSYYAVEIEDDFLLAYLDNNTIYYKITQKSEISLNSEDFNYYSNAKSFAITYFKTTKQLFFFRVDIDGNLFFTDFYKNHETFIDSNISHVSCTCNNNLILVSVVKNGKCYTFELDKLFTPSNQILVDCHNIYIEKSYLHFNEFNNKFYLIVTDKNSSNYLLETIDEYEFDQSFINVDYNIDFSSYEVTE